MKLNQALSLNPVKVRRSTWGNWITPENDPYAVNLMDLLADDWEVEEKSVTVSRTKLAQLMNKHIATDFDFNKKFESLIKELGL